MIDLPMKAEVFCSDGPAGHFTHVVGKQGNHEVTHLVVKSYLPPFREFLVPADQIEGTTNNRINLKCTRADLNKMELFEYEEFIQTELPAYILSSDVPDVPATPWGTMQPVNTIVPVKYQNVPQDESTLECRTRVEATDGYVGQVDELLINSKNMQVTHFVMLERHIFQKREITIPVSQIDRVLENVIYLKLDRKSVEELPTTPIQRWQEKA
jgi:hypothetical protein